MKKIVAVVLALVMVLGLSTVAFADNTTTTLKADAGYSIYAVDGTTALVEKTAIDKVVTGNSVASDGTVTYYAPVYTVGGKMYAEVDASVAMQKLVKDGAVVAYLTEVAAAPSTTVVVDKAVKTVKAAAAVCGDYVGDGEAVVYVVKDKAYEAAMGGNATWAVLNGKFVLCGAVATPVTHNYDFNTYNTDGSLATVKCLNCKAVYSVLSATQVKGMAPAAYTTWGSYYVATGVVAGSAAGETVESAKTFDAGIAMYVGMSVMAAAGSAVVLKKKD